MDAEIKAEILRAAVSAPSADNSQPWLFHWDGNRLDLGIDPRRSGGISDARHVLSDLAVGACLENILIRGRSLGFEADVQLFPTDDELWPAWLTWKRADKLDEDLAAAIPDRHTDRRFPWRGPISAADRARLADRAVEADAELRWLDDKPLRRQALRVLRRAETLRFKSPRLHAELFSSVRFDVGWHAAAPEGLPPAALAVGAPIRPLFQALRRPGLMAALNRVGGAHLLGFRSAALPARLSPGLGLICTAGTERAHVIAAGRALERLWLEATRQGLALQPFAAAGVMALNFLFVEPSFRPQIDALQAAMRPLCPGAHGLLFVRLGHAGAPAGWRSGRRTTPAGAVSESFTV
ncbi:MAG TPA: hypothetical protein VFK45_06870 [Gammaproteobacteria bacterium]|nr:hypothetical protein [Gammaproteobacteria bacterium]